MKKILFSIIACFCVIFVSACGKDDSSLTKHQKYEAEVGFVVTIDTSYILYPGVDTSAFVWLISEEEKPELSVLFNITEPSGNSDEANATFSNRYENGQYMKELNSNIVSAKFENEEQLYDVKSGDELKIITTIKKSEKYNFDYFTQSKDSENVEVKEDGDNILVISKITVEDPSDSEDESDESEFEDEYTTLSGFEDYIYDFASKIDDKITDFKAEELTLTKNYPIKVAPLFFASYTHTYVNGTEITRQTAFTQTPSQGYSSIETGPDLSDYDGPLTEEEIERIKAEGIERYQELLDDTFSRVIGEFEIITSERN